MKFDNDDLLDFLIATDQIDDFLGNDKSKKEEIKKEIKKIEEYIKRLESNGIYTDWQRKDLEYNKKRLNELKQKLS